MIRMFFGLGFGLAVLASGAAAQSTCSAWNTTCQARCKEAGANPDCRSYCASQLSSCKKSGCWTEGARFGNAKHCSLKKE